MIFVLNLACFLFVEEKLEEPDRNTYTAQREASLHEGKRFGVQPMFVYESKSGFLLFPKN